MDKIIYYDGDIFVKYERTKSVENVNYSMHTHELYELYYFLDGVATFRVEGNTYHLQPGDVMLFNISEAHTIEVLPGHPYERVAINFSREVFDSIDPLRLLQRPFCEREAGKGNLLRPKDFKTKFFEGCIQKIIAEKNDIRFQTLTILPALLNEVSVAYFSKKSHNDTQEESIASRISNYINRNLTEPLSVTEIAERFYMSKSRLHTVFKEALGSSVWNYITVKRLLLARQLLHTGGKPTEVFLKCGFNDYTAFFRAYRKQFGVSPKEDCKKAGTGI